MRARLINPEWVTVRPIDRAATRGDDLAAEPYARIARGAAVRLKAQVDEGDMNRRAAGQGGARVTARGTITFLIRDVRATGWTPKNGDRIVQIENIDTSNARDVAWYIGELHALGKERKPRLWVFTLEPRPSSRAVVEGI